MIKSAARGVVVTALTTAIALLPSSAQAEGSDKDNEIERVELTGVTAFDTSPQHIRTGDRWLTRLELYTENTAKSEKKKPKNEKTAKKSSRQPLRAGDGESECSAIHVRHHEVTTQCTRVLRLKKGTLTLSDMITYNPHQPVTAKTAIIGGTGHYRSAYGDGYITLDGGYVHLELNVDE
ncbi:hypothetical protein [Streptomyces sp. AC555_RSS877]|uniref:hypothetical protein n=1 Tax=Streptomyces sp. AC555_RSS877 TaxID=2823688 RepID=UPI001C263F3A|nr:hypothetical protein [Streptomyces sp. AC555_RSS877]